MDKQELLKSICDLADSVASLSRDAKSLDSVSRAALGEELRQLKEKYRRLRLKQETSAQLARLQRQTGLLGVELRRKNLAILSLQAEVAEIGADADGTELVNRTNCLDFSSEEVILYSCKISNFIQSCNKARFTDTVFPWSFGLNYLVEDEMNNSYLYHMYKNNPHYARLSPPKVLYIQGCEKNIKSTQTNYPVHSIEATGKLGISFQIGKEERLLISNNNRVPTIYDEFYPASEILMIQTDTILKIKSSRPGFIESEMLEFRFRIIETNEVDENEVRLPYKEMRRPDELNEDFWNEPNPYDGLLNEDDGFSSIHIERSYSTPGL
jgi:hypothetical protein